MRGLISPMLATLVPEPVDRPGWVYEEKYDGDRAIAYRRRRRVRIYSRNLKDITADFDEIARAVAGLPGGDLILDGEIVIFDRHDISRFQLLQRRGMGEPLRPVFAIFDCLARDGVSLLRRPLAERRRALEAVVPAGRGVLLRSRRLPGNGFRAYRTAQTKGWEGIIAKDDASPYEPGRRSRSWLKVKCRRESEFVIGGYTAPAGRRRHLGALLVGLYDRGNLRYAGKVGAGFSDQTLGELARQLAPLRTGESPFHPAPRDPGTTWVRPTLVAQIAFAEWTADGKLRQPAFLGLRTDKAPAECRWSERER
jgi:bifunctional non-homologous end joining protein LigD